MSFESDLYADLNVAAVTALVGDDIVPAHEASGVSGFEYLVYTTVFDDRKYDLEGATGARRVRLQIDCYSETYDGAKAIADAVINAIPQTGFPLHRTAHSEQDFGIEPGTRLFRRMLEFSIFHRS